MNIAKGTHHIVSKYVWSIILPIPYSCYTIYVFFVYIHFTGMFGKFMSSKYVLKFMTLRCVCIYFLQILLYIQALQTSEPDLTFQRKYIAILGYTILCAKISGKENGKSKFNAKLQDNPINFPNIFCRFCLRLILKIIQAILSIFSAAIIITKQMMFMQLNPLLDYYVEPYYYIHEIQNLFIYVICIQVLGRNVQAALPGSTVNASTYIIMH